MTSYREIGSEALNATFYEMRYAFAGWIVLGVVCLLIYFFHSAVTAALIGIAGLMLVQFCYHVKWEYEGNDDWSLLEAFFYTTTSYILTFVGLIGFLFVVAQVESMTGLPILLSMFFLIPVLFIGYVAYNLDLPKDL